VTFTSDAQFDPSALEAAVSKVDFTPTGVTVWLRGAVSTDNLPAVDTDEVAAWLVDTDGGQRFLLVADDDTGKAAILAASTAPAGSITLHGRATRNDDTALVTVRVQGSSEGE